jgi:hypothetical protein
LVTLARGFGNGLASTTAGDSDWGRLIGVRSSRVGVNTREGSSSIPAATTSTSAVTAPCPQESLM